MTSSTTWRRYGTCSTPRCSRPKLIASPPDAD
jgi:hypothetical protein